MSAQYARVIESNLIHNVKCLQAQGLDVYCNGKSQGGEVSYTDGHQDQQSPRRIYYNS
jgi:hypothetical protein